VPSIGVIGEYDPGNETHVATDDALGHSAMRLGTQVDVEWVSSEDVGDAGDGLGAFEGLLIAPGSPYRSQDGALAAITHARTVGVPLLGTCGGFQHLVIEFARHVAGIAGAEHGESHPDAPTLMVSPLTCSLVGEKMSVEVRAGTRAGDAYPEASVTEHYYCRFGLNPAYVDDLVGAGLVVSGTDQDGEVRIVELAGHPFFVGTLFVPQARSTIVHPHPLVTAFVAAAKGG
jgi:CTP synthase (UTP-ammonia lyase)